MEKKILTKSLAQKIIETRGIYSTENDVPIEQILTTLLGKNIPDKTLTALMSINLIDFFKITKEQLLSYPGIKPNMADKLIAAIALAKKLSKAVPTGQIAINEPEDVFTC